MDLKTEKSISPFEVNFLIEWERRRTTYSSDHLFAVPHRRVCIMKRVCMRESAALALVGLQLDADELLLCTRSIAKAVERVCVSILASKVISASAAACTCTHSVNHISRDATSAAAPEKETIAKLH